MDDKHDEWDKYRDLLWAMHFLDLLSYEERWKMHDECLEVLREL